MPKNKKVLDDGQADMQELMGDVEVNPIETEAFEIFKVED